MKTEPSGAKVRLHFTPSGTVNEAKNLETGATHTPAEFAADRPGGLRKVFGGAHGEADRR